MWKFLYFCMICFLCGCVSDGKNGHDGRNGYDGKSVYQIWLENGNVGTEQDFLNSLKPNIDSDNSQDNTDDVVSVVVPENVYPENMAQDYRFQDFDFEKIIWGGHGYVNMYKNETDFDTYDIYADAQGNNKTSKHKQVYYEKEMALANYGVGVQYDIRTINEFGSEQESSDKIITFIHNREGIGKNVYVPENNTAFSGDTMAYVYKTDLVDGKEVILDYEFVSGDAVYLYNNANPMLTLNFEDYYSFVMDKNGNVSISGNNDLGNSEFDLRTGENVNNDGRAKSGINNIGFVKKENTEEVVGAYKMDFSGYDDGFYNTDIYMQGAFGCSK